MNNIVFRSYTDIPVNRREVFRYMHCETPDETMNLLLNDCIEEAAGVLSYKTCFCEFLLSIQGDELNLGFSVVKSKALSINLKGCERVILFAATIGHDMDRLIKRTSLLSPSKAVCFQALGSERVESLCDTLNSELKAKYGELGYSLKPRFSPGYGDLPLLLQKSIMPVLDCKKLLGITLMDNLMMAPSKSVTALIGVYKR